MDTDIRNNSEIVLKDLRDLQASKVELEAVLGDLSAVILGENTVSQHSCKLKIYLFKNPDSSTPDREECPEPHTAPV